MLYARLLQIIDKRELSALFQPIVHMQTGEIVGYEGLIRGPSDSPLHAPLNLFKVARANNLTVEVEHLCRRVVLEKFAELGLPGKLFLNVSPECLLHPKVKFGETMHYIQQFGLTPEQVIIELTESVPTYDYSLLSNAVSHYGDMGFKIAIDDLGEGFSSLRLWSELRPAYVKIDMHFVQGINLDKVKLQFVRSIQEIARATGTIVIAEGIETQTELLLIRDLGIACGQGYHLGRPVHRPPTALAPEVAKALQYRGVAVYPQNKPAAQRHANALRLLRAVAPIASTLTNNDVFQIFASELDLDVVPVVDDGMPVGLITRRSLFDRFATQYTRELHGRKPCTMFMDDRPFCVDKNTLLQDLSKSVVEAEKHHLFNGFIITDNGRYLGMGTGHDLIREITSMQLHAARYANPLTLLPGNVPINEHIERLLENGARFSACYVDLDNFKPFNDFYGYRKGDDVIELLGRILEAHSDPACDFVGHIGGDDFLVLFQSDDWETRCNSIVASFGNDVRAHFHAADLARGGYFSEDRSGRKVLNALTSVSIGAVKVEPGHYCSHHQIAAAASEAKKQAKRIAGNSLFVDRRTGPCVPSATTAAAGGAGPLVCL